MSASKPEYLSMIPQAETGKERTNAHRLSSDFPICTVAHIHAYTQINAMIEEGKLHCASEMSPRVKVLAV